MSMVLVLKCAALGFALAVAATVGVLAGPLSAGLALVTFLLGAVTNELFQMRLSPVAAGAHGDSDSAFLALLEASASAPEAVAAGPPPPPKRNFRITCDGMATGSGLLRNALVSRSRRQVAPLARRPTPRPEPRPAPRPEPALPDARTFRAAYVERLTG